MRFSSAFIELPTPPFGLLNATMTSDLPQAMPSISIAEKAPTALQAPSRENIPSSEPASIDPKPVETPSAPLPQIQPQLPDRASIVQASSSGTAAAVQSDKQANSIPLGNTFSEQITPTLAAQKPVEALPTPVPQVQSHPQNSAPIVQTLSATASAAELRDIPNGPPVSEKGNSSLSELLPIAPRPINGQSTSLPQVQPQLQVTAPRTQTAAPEVPVKQKKTPFAPRQRKSATKTKRGRKRRRGHDSDNEVIRAGDSSSDESDIAPSATQTKSGRQINRPSLYVPPTVSPTATKETTNSPSLTNTMAAPVAPVRKRGRAIRKRKDTNVNCVRCQRGHSPLTNAIVFCDECNKAWHQLCHDPPIDNEVVTVQEKEWLCGRCRPVPIKLVFPSIVRSNPISQSRPLAPPVQPPLPTVQVEVGGEGYSKDERRGYLSTLSHATLVDLLVTISDQNPSLPLFPANLRSLPISKFSYQSTAGVTPHSNPADTPATSSSVTQATNTHSTDQATNQNSLDQTPDSLPDPSAQKRRYEESPDESEYEEVEDHRLYPRAGNGFRLSLNIDDLDIMQEDPACPTFSYALHGPAKTRAEANEAAPVWGAA
ncbi:PHD finger domain protein [Aspergillus sclerotialis]|uniref:PHD finger domain protein n=1 Tax=Aspergillus sclerotialis TaxID=2070753 RepID=A0A3A2ZT22_9EURO|nr:PHD finger domain protein [Aspergillus sclerotialis]